MFIYHWLFVSETIKCFFSTVNFFFSSKIYIFVFISKTLYLLRNISFWLNVFHCQLLFLSVHGNWGEWSNFTDCNVKCGGGEQTRTRSCDNPASQHGGDECLLSGDSGNRDKEEKETKECNMQKCAGNTNIDLACNDRHWCFFLQTSQNNIFLAHSLAHNLAHNLVINTES